jgi:hypothetical protein
VKKRGGVAISNVIESTSVKELDEMSEELCVLYRLQYEALQKSSYLQMPQKEADVYDRRRVRIGELCDLLTKFRVAGS